MAVFPRPCVLQVTFSLLDIISYLSVLAIPLGVVAMPGVCESVHVMIRHSPVSVHGKQSVTVAKGLTLQEDFHLASPFTFPASRWGTHGG